MVSVRSYKVVLALTVLVLLGAAPQAPATFPGANGILGWSEGPGINGLAPGSSTPHLIVDVPGGLDRGLAWSADGQRIAFMHDEPTAGVRGPLWVANADGTGATQITTGTNDRDPSWSPDGQKIVFSRTGDLFVVDADGSNLTQLPATGIEPSWSPDGSKIAFEYPGQEIWLMNPDGSGQTFLADGFAPDWSPNGEELAITGQSSAPEPGIRRLFLDGTLTPSLTPTKPDASRPAFSPDGTQIAFSVFGANTISIFTTGYTGGAIVTPPGGTNRNSPAWQPVPPFPAEPYVRPKGATPIYASLVPAYQACESPDREHGPPLAFGSCSSPTQTSTTATVGTSDANGAAARSVGYVRFGVVPGDVNVTVDITDVRRSSNNADYPLSLDLPVFVRITGKETPTVSSTLYDVGLDPNTTLFYSWPLRVQAPCATNLDPAIGSHCSVSTTLDAVLPGSTPAGGRSIWGLQQVRLYDSGPDEDVSTTDDNELFAVQGVFVP